MEEITVYECECGGTVFRRYLLDVVEIQLHDGRVVGVPVSLGQAQYWCAACGRNQRDVLRR